MTPGPAFEKTAGVPVPGLLDHWHSLDLYKNNICPFSEQQDGT